MCEFVEDVNSVNELRQSIDNASEKCRRNHVSCSEYLRKSAADRNKTIVLARTAMAGMTHLVNLIMYSIISICHSVT